MKRSVALILAIATFVTLATLAGCGGKEDETAGWSANKLYGEAKSALDDGGYETAIKYYEKLESRYPYGRYAQQAQIEVAYAYFKSNEPESAITACDRFIKLHPNHPNVDYAYYLKGLVNFNEDQGIFGWISDQDLSERDPKAARDSFDAFKELATRFPDSKYAPDSRLRMKYLINTLAAHEVHVARYYMKRGAYIAAANRAQYAIEHYPQAPTIEEAMVILMQAYAALGLTDLRDSTQRVLLTNFPKSPYMQPGGVKKNVPWWRLWDPDW